MRQKIELPAEPGMGAITEGDPTDRAKSHILVETDTRGRGFIYIGIPSTNAPGATRLYLSRAEAKELIHALCAVMADTTEQIGAA